MKAHFVIKNRFQKGGLYQNLLTASILIDVCVKITGQRAYTVDFVDAVNIGRLATLEYNGTITYISFSENQIGGRNASFQSFPSAFVNFYNESNLQKRICFYFLPTDGSFETNYFVFMYRLMKTLGTEFINETAFLTQPIVAFSTVEDIILNKNAIRSRNKSNNSTYLTKDENNTLQIFGKTYGASKYETTLLCIAISEITTSNIELYEIKEGDLTQLPKAAREVIDSIDKITIITSDLRLERKEFEENNSLRSPTYIYNLLEKLGEKKCALCNCEIPQIIQGAHVWPVASIKNAHNINLDEKLKSAIDGDNGIWLCNNHHKLFDINWLLINEEGRIKYKSNIRKTDEDYIYGSTVNVQIQVDILTPNFLHYLQKRNRLIDADAYQFIGEN
jgi:hypothetical protein